MTVEKIKIRNLDKEVLKEFRNSKDLIGFDSLDESVVLEIKNQGSGGTLNQYNDRELRNRIALLENNKLSIDVAQNYYLSKEDGATKVYIDEKESNLIKNINEIISTQIASATDGMLKNEEGVIFETMLSSDLQDKINLRYENNRKEAVNSGVDISDFNKLTISVNRNTSDIESLQSYINNNVVHNNDKILLSQLSQELQTIINNSRQKTISITLADMDDDLQSRLSLSSSDLQEIKNIQNSFNGKTGQTFFAVFDNATGKTNLSAKYIMANNVVLIKQTALLEEAEKKVLEDLEHDIDYIIDSEANKLYQYSYKTSLWEESKETPYSFIAGCFINEYNTDNLYFSSSEDEYELIIEASKYLVQSDIDDVVREKMLSEYVKNTQLDSINNDIISIKELIKGIDSNKNSITAIQDKLTDLEETISNLLNRVSALEEANKGTVNQ